MTRVSPKCVQIAFKKLHFSKNQYPTTIITIFFLSFFPFFFFFLQLWDLSSLIRDQTQGSESTEF